MTFAYALIVVALQVEPNTPLSDVDAVETIVQRIRTADYEGDRAQLKRLHTELEPFVRPRALSVPVRYWRGFAMWRRALNGFNDAANRSELEQDLNECVADFRAALAEEPSFADAKAGAASCLVNHSFLLMKTDATRARAMFEESNTLIDGALATEPTNPRVLWVLGANQYYSPSPEGKARAIETYERGLTLGRAETRRGGRPLDPAWGEPEMLMNLAFANFKKTPADLDRATRYAEQALTLVPYWHYVRDVLLPAIKKAKDSRANVALRLPFERGHE